MKRARRKKTDPAEARKYTLVARRIAMLVEAADFFQRHLSIGGQAVDLRAFLDLAANAWDRASKDKPDENAIRRELVKGPGSQSAQLVGGNW